MNEMIKWGSQSCISDEKYEEIRDAWFYHKKWWELPKGQIAIYAKILKIGIKVGILS